MKIGFLSPYDQERISFMKQHDFRCVELFASGEEPYCPGHDGWKDKAAEVKAAYDEAGIEISCLAGFYFNAMDADPEVAKKHATQVRNVITLAAEMKVPAVGGFAGRIVDAELEESIPKFKEIWTDHAQFAADHGVKIAFEHCPFGKFHSVFTGGINCICTPLMFDRCFDAVPNQALGLEWDPSHWVCMFVDPIENIQRYADRIHHVHAKDAKIRHELVRRYGIYHHEAIEHCFPGLGECDWGQIVKELLRAGYDGGVNIEGWHDHVFVDRHGKGREDWGLLLAKRHLEQFIVQD
jgi:sugar phosphate isomerase/epimerase